MRTPSLHGVVPADVDLAAAPSTTFAVRVFALNTIGTIGSGSGSTAGAGLVDYSVFKSFAVRERARLQFRWKFFNHANLDTPDVTVNGPSFGLIFE
jgi:hypothetical protein